MSEYIKMKCASDGCDRFASTRTLCNGCATRERRAGRIHLYPKMKRRKDPDRFCEIAGCEALHAARGMCISHYRKWQRQNKKCQVEGCDRRTCRALCLKHARGRANLPPVRDFSTLRDEFGRKRCNGCAEWLDESNFWRNTAASDGLITQCKLCTSMARKIAKYGNSIPALWRMQNGQCAICLRMLGDVWSVDHDHSAPCGCGPDKGCDTCVRALLCRGCNLGLGNFAESVSAMRRAAQYIEDHAAVHAGDCIT